MWTCLRIAQARQLYPNEQCSKPRVVDDHRGLHTHTNQSVGDCHIPLENPYQPTSIKRGHRVLNTAQIGLSENREPRNPFICLFIIIFRQILHNLSSKLSPDWLGPWVACAVWQLDQAIPGFIAIIENGKLLGKACTALAWAWLKMVRQSG